MKNVQLVWFKRDLRTHDHSALSEAAKQGPVYPVYIIEPQLWQQPDLSGRQYEFLLECLNDLKLSLDKLGSQLIIRVGEATEVLAQLHKEINFKALWSHQETWNMWTYQRDKAVKQLMKQLNIPWHEPRQNAVFRGEHNRNTWALQADTYFNKPLIKAPEHLDTIDSHSDAIPTPLELKLNDDCPKRQHGGRRLAIDCLKSFLNEREKFYLYGLASPLKAIQYSSRLSPHIAFGTLSLREIIQATHKALNKTEQTRQMKAFYSRLRWHCHFIQKLEDEPEMEFENVHHDYDGMREGEFNQLYFEAWKDGKTGYPLIDACMRSLKVTGWLNFRMRAMVVSFASYHLWLPWQPIATYLATQFTDYEPGIHYSQIQMQSGTTGINSIRIYNPIKQGLERDAKGEFIKQWVPELITLGEEMIHTPWLANNPPEDYPTPIVDEKEARKKASDIIFSIKKGKDFKKSAKKIFDKHGSRRKTFRRARKKKQSEQKSFDF